MAGYVAMMHAWGLQRCFTHKDYKERMWLAHKGMCQRAKRAS